MLKRQYKIFAFIGLLLVIWMFTYHEQYILVVKRIHNYFHSIDDAYGIESYTLPNFKEEARNNAVPRRLWFMAYGDVKPKPSDQVTSNYLFPDPKKPYDDRIPRQLMYVPHDYGLQSPLKMILLYNYIGDWIPHEEGSKAFMGCPVDKCILTTKREKIKYADAVMFDDKFRKPSAKKLSKQVWIIYMLESPPHTNTFEPADLFNWTVTYRPDSDLPSPYGRWYYHGPEHRKSRPLRNYASNKTGKVAWFASNCHANNLRLEYTKELQKYIQVDIFGKCGQEECPRSNEEQCYKLLAKKYKFYLAFENSNCDYYVTEKFFRNALRHDVIPVVMGARRGDYEHVAPEGSFIHVDDFQSPEELAKFLHKLDNDDELYNQYFLWRGTGEFIYDHLFCRLCALLHSDYPKKYYRNINQWWRSGKRCSFNN